jgi:hypothetical protein
MVKLDFKGQEEMLAHMRQIARENPALIAGALYRQASKILTESMEHFVPVRFGILRDSGRVQEPTLAGERTSVEITFGGQAAAYAIAVHETPSRHDPPSWKKAWRGDSAPRVAGISITRLGARSPHASGNGVHFRAPGTGSKYLEKPLMAAAPGLLRALATDLHFGQ